MNIKNAITIVACMTIGFLIGYYTNYSTSKMVIKQQQEVMIEAVKKNTSEIVNEFKIKNKKSGSALIDLVSEATTTATKEIDDTVKKKRWRLFRKK